MNTHDTTGSAHGESDPIKSYIAVFAALIVLLFVTVGVYFIPFEKIKTSDGDLGWVNTAVALTIATLKTTLVVLVFMHLRHSTRLTWVVASAGFIFLGIMILFTFADYNSRRVIRESVHASETSHADGETLLMDVKNQVKTDGW